MTTSSSSAKPAARLGMQDRLVAHTLRQEARS